MRMKVEGHSLPFSLAPILTASLCVACTATGHPLVSFLDGVVIQGDLFVGPLA